MQSASFYRSYEIRLVISVWLFCVYVLLSNFHQRETYFSKIELVHFRRRRISPIPLLPKWIFHRKSFKVENNWFCLNDLPLIIYIITKWHSHQLRWVSVGAMHLTLNSIPDPNTTPSHPHTLTPSPTPSPSPSHPHPQDVTW
jgi:hypothetical protein